jgi:hypothetical protein
VALKWAGDFSRRDSGSVGPALGCDYWVVVGIAKVERFLSSWDRHLRDWEGRFSSWARDLSVRKVVMEMAVHEMAGCQIGSEIYVQNEIDKATALAQRFNAYAIMPPMRFRLGTLLIVLAIPPLVALIWFGWIASKNPKQEWRYTDPRSID